VVVLALLLADKLSPPVQRMRSRLLVSLLPHQSYEHTGYSRSHREPTVALCGMTT
jgi:hypothetical protein